MSGGGEAYCAEWSHSSMLRGLSEAPMPRGGPCAAERRPLCREEVHCAEWSYSSMLRGLREAPMPRGGPLCR